jgi:hypothetical protein
MRLTQYIDEASKPELKDGEYAIPLLKKEKVRDLNPRTNRMKNFKRTRWMVTDVPPEKRTFDNLPRNKDKSPKVSFRLWLGISKPGDRATNGRFYGWSHRAIASFGKGDIIKPGVIGNKYQYGEGIDKKYQEIWKSKGMEEADKWRDSLIFEPYKIETDEEAKEHAVRFTRDVS